MASVLPLYQNPCLAASSRDSSTVYLIGVPDTGENVIQITVVNITDTSRPIIKVTRSTDPNYQWSSEKDWRPNEQWKSDAQKLCFSYLGQDTAVSPIYIQQFGNDTTQQIVYFPESNTFNQLERVWRTTFHSRRSYAFVGQVGYSSWAVGTDNTTDNLFDNTTWRSLQWNGAPGVQTKGFLDYLPNRNLPTRLTEDPLLTVGSFAVSQNEPATGTLIIFDRKGGGEMYRTVGISYALEKELIDLEVLQAVNMDGIKLTPDAIYASINSSAYILDKADDGTVATYLIDPSISNNLQRVSTLNKPPSFPSTMAATASGSVIILYAALNDGQARLHFLDTTSKEWDRPYIPIPEPDPTSSPPAGNNIAVVVGGAIGGVALLAITAYLFIRHRRQRNSGNSKKKDTSIRSSSDNTNYKEEKFPQSKQRPQFPAGVGLAYGEQYEIDLNVSLLAPQGIPLQPQYHKPPAPRVDPSELDQYAYLETDAVRGPQDSSHRSQVGENKDIYGPIPLVLRQPPTPPPIPTRPSNHVYYSLVRPQD